MGCFISQYCLIQQIFFMLSFISASFVSLLCLALFAAADLVKQVRLISCLSSLCAFSQQTFMWLWRYVYVHVHFPVCVCVSA